MDIRKKAETIHPSAVLKSINLKRSNTTTLSKTNHASPNGGSNVRNNLNVFFIINYFLKK